MKSSDLQALEAKLGHNFSQPQLLTQALTHRSFSADHNERLEFLGDAVLNLTIASLLYERLDAGDEGDLSRVRASLVKQQSLYERANDLGIANLLRLGDGECRSGGQRRPSILADALEAILGAVYLDAGYAVAECVVKRLFGQLAVDSQRLNVEKDPKTQLQESMQKMKKSLPHYKVIATEGAAHLQKFNVLCTVSDPLQTTRGQGASRRAAEQEAAKEMLKLLACG